MTTPSVPYHSRTEAELRELLATYRENNGPCGMFARQIYEIEAELNGRSCDIALAIHNDPAWMSKQYSVLVAKRREVKETIYLMESISS